MSADESARRRHKEIGDAWPGATGYQNAVINGHAVSLTDAEVEAWRNRPYRDAAAEEALIRQIQARIERERS